MRIQWLGFALLPAAMPLGVAFAVMPPEVWVGPAGLAFLVLPPVVSILAWPPGRWTERSWFTVVLGSLAFAALVSCSSCVAGMSYEAQQAGRGGHGLPGLLSALAAILIVFPSCALALLVPRVLIPLPPGAIEAWQRASSRERWIRWGAWVVVALPFVLVALWIVSNAHAFD